ncbi:hypothetical protein HSRCO_0762 [Halanaeroarchaeum sp. HSR-CO]|uniref:hypothetical protein n=1 Tax=Halanaeroarchaeum sp. HSR-CO TaxID=2866382 RepID=UPI00217D7887|nr:hypothetical protein [Halanaeroarchaeum sp. HSR-CO]UWG47056.1 hypothetical protein HSRCO_0762 [Halanaeroarchaeum sp. HSR-CO]
MKFSDKLEEAEESRLDQIPGRATKGVNKVFEAVYDEILIDEPGAPERNDYDEQDHGYERYLYDLDEWARSGYVEAVEALREATAELEAEDYPELGMHRLVDEEIRDETGDDIIEIQDRLQDVIVWRKKLERIEQGFQNWD